LNYYHYSFGTVLCVAPEIKVIVGLAEKVKKFQLQIESLNAEKEELGEEKQRINTQLFFLMNKLQECEAILLEFMQKERTLRQQAASDNEVISHLDLQVQQLEGALLEARQKSGALQTSLDLQVGTHSMREEQLQSELNDYKLKYEQLEAKFRNERKLLAKEVKSVRAKIESLTVEKTQMSSKLTALRQALSIDVPYSSSGLHNDSTSAHHSPLVPPQSSNQSHRNAHSHNYNHHSSKHHYLPHQKQAS
jgi:chromosome segregation ATPase